MRFCYKSWFTPALCFVLVNLIHLHSNAGQRAFNYLVHIIVLILAQAAAEHNVRLGIGQCLVLGVQGAVLVIVDRVVRLVARLPLSGVFAADDRLGARLGGAELKVLVLNDAGVRGFGIGVVDDSVA